MSPNGGGVEHLHEMGGLAVRGERLEQGLEDTRLAQPPKAFPDAVPVAELGRERPPRDVVDREIVQRLEELAVVAGKRGKTPGKGYASGVDASGILLKTLSSLEPRTPRSGDLPGVLPLIRTRGIGREWHSAHLHRPGSNVFNS